MDIDDLLTRWTIRLSMLLFAATLASVLLAGARPKILGEARLAWTAGCGFLWLHLAAAFHSYHDWSHALAYAATARDTELAMGWSFGGGVYFNYLFVAIWTVDAVDWWVAGLRGPWRRPRWLNMLVYGFLLFMVFNATVVFGKGAVRWFGVFCFAVLAVRVAVAARSRPAGLA